MSAQVILVEDDNDLRAATAQTLELCGFDVESFDCARPALKRLSTVFAGVLVTDVRMPGMDGLALFERVAAIDCEIPVLLVTGHGDIAMAVRALKAGAFDFLAKPFSTEHLAASVSRALEKRTLVLDNRRLRAALARTRHDLVGSSTVMQALRAQAAQIARTELDVLIEGETGTGKELFARTIHSQSSAADGPFVSVHGAVIADSEPALCEALINAERGVLFVDEVGALAPSNQAILLDALESRHVRTRDGPYQSSSVRLIAASERALEPVIANGPMRSDLFFRINATRIAIPPLRERKEDIPLLFDYFIREATGESGRRQMTRSAAERRWLMENDWPGNVRELRAFAYSRALGLARPISILNRKAPSLAHRLAEYERIVLREALEVANGQVTYVSQMLGAPRKTLYDKLAKYGLKPEDYRK